MHRIVPLAALLLISSLAFAASDRQSKADLNALTVGGPSGNAIATQKAPQSVQITLQMKFLEKNPNIVYVARWHDASQCGGNATTLGTFRPNNQGIGHLVADASTSLSNLRSISIVKQSDPATTLSCGTFVQ